MRWDKGLSADKGRDLTLDFVKGLLVMAMVVYHVMNHFSAAGPHALGYVRFVSGSFIFISGYIIATFYEKRYQKDKKAISKRLITRGVKLLLIFTILNVLINVTGIRSPKKAPLDLEMFFTRLDQIYVWGDISLAAFQILLPISYLLIAAPAFLFFSQTKKLLFSVTFVSTLCLSLFGPDSTNLNLGLVGVIGLCSGMAVSEIKKPEWLSIRSRLVVIGCLALCIYVTGYLNVNTITYSIGIVAVIKLFNDLANNVDLRGCFSRAIILLGQYTLVCYIIQIVFLQGLAWVMSRPHWGLGWQTFSIFLLTDIFLLAVCSVMKYLQTRFVRIDGIYKAVLS